MGDVLPALTPRDVGPGGFVVLFPTKRSRLTRPFLRVPQGDGNGWVYLFDVLTTSAAPGRIRPSPRWTELVARKHRYDPRAILTPGPGIFG